MSGQVWSVPAEGGYLYADNLSDYLRMALQPRCKFRQMCDATDKALGLNRGDTYNWNVYSNVKTNGGPLAETSRLPETNFTAHQRSLTIQEYGNSVPYTGKLESLGEHDVKDIIDKTLMDDCMKTIDRAAAYQFFQTKLRAAPTGGTATDSVTITESGTTGITNNVAMGNDHVKAIIDEMKERNIPAFEGDDYACVTHPTTIRGFKNDLEDINKYTETGIARVYSGEVGRYESCRFVEQNNIPKGHANDAAFTNGSSGAYSIFTDGDEAWNNAKSSWAMFMGGDTVLEAPSIMEEIRGKLPSDYGRDKGIAWYFLGEFGIAHDQAENSRIVMWDSAA